MTKSQCDSPVRPRSEQAEHAGTSCIQPVGMDYLSQPEEIKKHLRKIRTPAFIFNPEMAGRQYKYLDSLFRKHLPFYLKKRWDDPDTLDGIYYAVKCNSHPMILGVLQEQGCKFEVNNMEELMVSVRQGANISKMINSSPITPGEQVSEMYNAGVRNFCVDSDDQIDNLKINAPHAYLYFRLFISRHGADLDLSKRLGLTFKSASEVIQYAIDQGMNAYGLTFHVGSQCGNKSNWKYGISKAIDLFRVFPQLKMLNVGGGLPFEYARKPENSAEEIVQEICNSMQEYFRDMDITFQVEPGRYLVAPTAFTVTSVTGLNYSRTPHRVVVDQSLFTGLVEKLEFDYDFQYPVQVDRANGKFKPYTIIGPTCDGTDVIADEIWLDADLKADHVDPAKRDRLFLLNTGGYTLEYTPRGNLRHGFNKAPFPDVYRIEEDKLIPVDVKDEPKN